MTLRDSATKIVEVLRSHGYQAYFAGGSVRDMLMKRTPVDIDLATSARPEEVRAIFKKTVAVGEQFGVILVFEDGHRFDVATFRSDGPYSDGRRPDRVTFTDVEGDVRRRDFTINGMMFDPIAGEVIDHVGGRVDIEAGLIRAIGEPHTRFKEDKLRLIRAVRFAARFEFEIETETRRAIEELASKIQVVSPERIGTEVKIILMHPSRARAIRLMDELGLLEHVLPEIMRMKGVEQNPEWHPEGDVFVHTLKCLEVMGDARWEVVLSVLLHDVGKPPAADGTGFSGHANVGAEIVDEICRRLRLSNRERAEVVWLVRNHMRFCDAKQMKESTLRRLMTEPLFEDLAELHRIDALASSKNFSNYDFVMAEYGRFLDEPPSPEPFVTGHDLIERGLEPGPAFSGILDEIFDAQLEGKITDRAGAISFLDDVLKRRGSS